MGVNLKDISYSTITPQCSECGVLLCWGIDIAEYQMWKLFWDNWTCSICNPNYKNAYQLYKHNHKPYQHLINLHNLIKQDENNKRID